MRFAVRAVAVIAQIDGDNATGFGQPPCQCTKIATLAVKAVNKKDRKTGILANDRVIQFHATDTRATGTAPPSRLSCVIMNRPAQNIDDIRSMADEVAQLMASRFGGARRGESPRLTQMFRRRGGALPGRLRRRARRLAGADAACDQPRVGRQLNARALERDYRALTAYLRPLGEISRFQGRLVGLAASVALGLMVLAVVAIWILMKRGMI